MHINVKGYYNKKIIFVIHIRWLVRTPVAVLASVLALVFIFWFDVLAVYEIFNVYLIVDAFKLSSFVYMYIPIYE